MEAIPVKHFVKHIMELYKNNMQGFAEEFEVHFCAALIVFWLYVIDNCVVSNDSMCSLPTTQTNQTIHESKFAFSQTGRLLSTDSVCQFCTLLRCRQMCFNQNNTRTLSYAFVYRFSYFDQMVKRKMERKIRESKVNWRRSLCWLTGWEHFLSV